MRTENEYEEMETDGENLEGSTLNRHGEEMTGQL